MPSTHPVSTPAALTQLTDQWTVLRERYAFLMEVLLRLVADHSDLAPDVIQGAIQNVQNTQHMAAGFSEALQTFRELSAIGRQEDSS